MLTLNLNIYLEKKIDLKVSANNLTDLLNNFAI